MKILLATDGSAPARSAEQFASTMYHAGTDTIVVTAIADLPDIFSGYEEAEEKYAGMSSAEIEEEFLKIARERVNDVANRLKKHGFQLETEVEVGKPGPEICSIADDLEVDSIVIGRRGRGKVQEVLLGSVSQYVLHNANCPVSIVPAVQD